MRCPPPTAAWTSGNAPAPYVYRIAPPPPATEEKLNGSPYYDSYTESLGHLGPLSPAPLARTLLAYRDGPGTYATETPPSPAPGHRTDYFQFHINHNPYSQATPLPDDNPLPSPYPTPSYPAQHSSLEYLTDLNLSETPHPLIHPYLHSYAGPPIGTPSSELGWESEGWVGAPSWQPTEADSVQPPPRTRNPSEGSAINVPSSAKKIRIKRHACPHCPKVFNRPSGLAVHAITHTEDKPYQCPVPECSKVFNVSSNLKRHIRVKGHSGDATSTRLPSDYRLDRDRDVDPVAHPLHPPWDPTPQRFSNPFPHWS
ncbi:hypothetical protein RQP46_005333 [Phenoliferia psychrophenolica]